MFKKKLLFFSVIALSSFNLYAGTIGNPVTVPSGSNVIAPEAEGTWTVGLEGAYVRASGNDFTYGLLHPILSTGTDIHENESVTNHAQWGYDLDLNYQFANSSRFLGINISQYDLDDSDGLSVPEEQIFLAPVLTPPSSAGMFPGSTASAEVDNKATAIDLIVGQKLAIGQRVNINLIGGLRWADIDLENKAIYNSVTGAGDPFVNTHFDTESKFQGIGPRVGINSHINVGSGVSFIGAINGSLLIGNLKSDVDNNRYAVNGSNDILQSYKNDNRQHVVPELDAKLGIGYTHAISASSAFNIQLGYQAVNYFDVSDTDWQDTNTPNTVNNNNDFGYYGPYIKGEISFA